MALMLPIVILVTRFADGLAVEEWEELDMLRECPDWPNLTLAAA
jgi:hypothetical protein